MRLLRTLIAGLVLAGSGLALVAAPRLDEKKADKKVVAEEIIGCKDTKLFHKASCKWTKEIEKAGTKVTFKNREEAVKAGYKACGDCKP